MPLEYTSLSFCLVLLSFSVVMSRGGRGLLSRLQCKLLSRMEKGDSSCTTHALLLRALCQRPTAKKAPKARGLGCSCLPAAVSAVCSSLSFEGHESTKYDDEPCLALGLALQASLLSLFCMLVGRGRIDFWSYDLPKAALLALAHSLARWEQKNGGILAWLSLESERASERTRLDGWLASLAPGLEPFRPTAFLPFRLVHVALPSDLERAKARRRRKESLGSRGPCSPIASVGQGCC